MNGHIIPRAAQLIAVGLAFALAPPALAADADAPEAVTFPTADGVKLRGRFFASEAGRKAPCVLVLDDLGESARPKACDRLARELRKQGCAVLCFDFRGQGGSTAVEPEFWEEMTNQRLVRGYHPTRPKEKIEFADFRPAYLPALVNDVSAARQFLDDRNDSGECNSRRVILVGTGEGAMVGALWLGAEWSRYRSFGTFPERLEETPEGRDVVGFVMAGPEFTLGRMSVNVYDCLRHAERDRSVLVGVLYDRQDRRADRFADQCAELLNDARPGPDGKKPKRIFAAQGFDAAKDKVPFIERADVMRETASFVKDMLKTAEPKPWKPRLFNERRYVWVLPGHPPLVAKLEGEKVMRLAPTDWVLGLRLGR